jgi:hypothetical protein
MQVLLQTSAADLIRLRSGGTMTLSPFPEDLTGDLSSSQELQESEGAFAPHAARSTDGGAGDRAGDAVVGVLSDWLRKARKHSKSG